ncbi:MAG: hypothetical protein WAX89_07560, partial [Alphaproteobacteria bacterium]
MTPAAMKRGLVFSAILHVLLLLIMGGFLVFPEQQENILRVQLVSLPPPTPNAKPIEPAAPPAPPEDVRTQASAAPKEAPKETRPTPPTPPADVPV